MNSLLQQEGCRNRKSWYETITGSGWSGRQKRVEIMLWIALPAPGYTRAPSGTTDQRRGVRHLGCA